MRIVIAMLLSLLASRNHNRRGRPVRAYYVTTSIVPIREPFLGNGNYKDTSLLSILLISRTSALWLGALRLEARLDLPGLISSLRTFERFTIVKVRK
jgi:hypothetical protein